MRKCVFIAIVCFFTIACQNDQGQTAESFQTVESVKSEGMRKFDGSLKEIAKSKGKFVDKNKQLSVEGIDLLYPAAKTIAMEAGMDENEIRTKGKKEILKFAFSMYHKNLAQYRNEIKSNN